MPADAGDAYNGWTVQQNRTVTQPDDLPGQVYAQSQLPDPELQKDLGPNYPALYANVGGTFEVLTDKEAVKHPQGPTQADLDESASRRKAVEAYAKEVAPARVVEDPATTQSFTTIQVAQPPAEIPSAPVAPADKGAEASTPAK